MWWLPSPSSSALALGLCLVGGPAHAASCCAGPTTTIPTRLGQSETGAVSVTTSGTGSVGRWDTDGQVSGSSLQEQAIVATLSGGWRWDAKGQIGLSIPVQATHKATSAADAWGGGLGDIRVYTVWEPVEARPAVVGTAPVPVPVLTVSLRLPTGRTWVDAQDPLGADVTGRPGVATSAMLTVERTIDRVPWLVGVGIEVEADDHGVRPSLDLTAGLGGAFGIHWSLMGSLSHRQSWAKGAGDWARTARTTAGLQVTYGVFRKLRVWGGLSGDLPIPHLGQDLPLELRGTLGFAQLF